MLAITRVVLQFLICVLVLIMVVSALPSSRHETLDYARALAAYIDAPSDVTRKALADVKAKEDGYFLKTEAVLGVALVTCWATVSWITKRHGTQTS